MPTVVVIGTLDTKGAEVEFVADRISSLGCTAWVVDTGVHGEPRARADVTREDVARAGGHELADLVARADRGAAVSAMTAGIVPIVARLRRQGRLDAVIGVGGGAGTTIGTAAMRALPLGIPKVMVSTLAGGDVRGFVGVSDVVMIPAIVDISGLNRVSRGVLARAAGAVCGMLREQPDLHFDEDAPLIAASMFGNTTQCVEQARAVLESHGYEVLVFHATGTGGRTMESLIEAGQIAGVLDVTTTEWADELVGGVLTAGSTRLEAAARTGTPAVVAPGCLDMVNFWGIDTLPEAMKGRRIYEHNEQITLVRTTPEENVRLAGIVADKLNASTGPVAVFLPLRGISAISAPGQPFHWPEADRALFETLKAKLRPDIPRHEMDCNINDAQFAQAMAGALLDMCGRLPPAA